MGDVRLRFIGQYTRFENPEDGTIPLPTEGGGVMRGSSMNTPVGAPSMPPPPSAYDMPPMAGNPFEAPGNDAVPF